MVKAYFKIIQLLFVIGIVYGFIGPKLISANNDIEVALGVFVCLFTIPLALVMGRSIYNDFK